MFEKNSHASWLYSCPCSDGNFKNHLENATNEEIRKVIAELSEKGNKSKILTLQRELKRRKDLGK